MRDGPAIAFLQWALPRMGLRYRGFRNVRGTVFRRLRRRLAELGLGFGTDDLAAYRARLEADPAEWDVLAAMCRIPISRFYRDRAVYDRLANELLPARAEAAIREGRLSVRVWSATCASGEEPYTVSILWHLVVRHASVQLDLLATDIEESMLVRAARRTYGEGSLRELPEPLREAAFVRDTTNESFVLREEMARGVRFERADIRTYEPKDDFDVILCRNSAFTYFDEPTQRAVSRRLVDRLRRGGVIIVGCHEHLPDV